MRAVERLALTAVAAIAAMGFLPVVPAGSEGPAVIVHLDGDPVSIYPGELTDAYDVFDTAYTIRATDGTEEYPRPQLSGASVRRVVQLAGADPDRIGFLETRRADHTWITLDSSDIAADPPFPDGPALIFYDSGTRFLRPVRGPGDANGTDNLGTYDGRPLELFVHSGNLLDVRTEPDSAIEVDKGEQVRFSAESSGQLAGESVSYDWDFGDGATGSGAVASHAFDRTGRFFAFATAAGSRESAGTSALVSVVVGDPEKDPDDDGPGGGHNRDPDANPSGPGFGGGNLSAGLGDEPGFGEGGSGGGSSDAGSSTAPQPATAPEGDGEPDSSPADLAADSSARRQDREDRHRPPAGSDLVSGRLLGSTAPAPTAESTPVAAAASRPAAAGTSVPALALGVLVLAGCGAAIELRGRRSSWMGG